MLLVDLDGDRAQAVAAAMDDARGIACDITSPRDIAALAAAVAGEGGFDAWLHVAGLSPSLADYRTIMRVNLLGPALLAAALLLVAAYPFMKRITWWPQAWLGLTFNWGALLGFAAGTGHVDLPDLFLYAGLFFWTLGYDTIYAHQDKEDDALIGVKSTARLLMQDSGKWILRFYAVCFTLVLAAGFAEHAGWPFAFIMAMAGAHMIWQVRKLKIDDAANCLTLFRANSATGGLMALSFAAATWLVPLFG